MAISIGSDAILMQQNASSAATARTNKLSASLDSIDKGAATDEELMEACKDFESYLVEQVIKSAKKAMLQDEESEGEYMKYFGDHLTQSYAEMITETGDLGIAQMLYESMKRN